MTKMDMVWVAWWPHSFILEPKRNVFVEKLSAA